MRKNSPKNQNAHNISLNLMLNTGQKKITADFQLDIHMIFSCHSCMTIQ